jgi:hypothetical protein
MAEEGVELGEGFDGVSLTFFLWLKHLGGALCETQII